MRLFEFQAKRLLSTESISIPRSVLINSHTEASSAVRELGVPCMIKAQVLRGGRGKDGLVQHANSSEEIESKVKTILDSDLGCNSVLLEQCITAKNELYIAITIDPIQGMVVMLGSTQGGVEIEDLARTAPEQIVRQEVEPGNELSPFQVRNFIYEMKLDKETSKQLLGTIPRLYNIFWKYDAELVEINPLFLTSKKELIAGDAKIIVDDSSLFRQRDFELTREHFASDVEYEASKEGIPYLQFSGDIGLMCAGAGLTNTVFDLIHDAEGTVACYLEFGGPNYRKAVRALELCLKTPSKVILIVTFGTIARADVIAEGLVEAINKLHPYQPIIACIRGTNENKAHGIMQSAGIVPLIDTEEAVQRAVALTTGAGEL